MVYGKRKMHMWDVSPSVCRITQGCAAVDEHFTFLNKIFFCGRSAYTLSSHVARNWVVQCRSYVIPHSLLVVDSSCGHDWCLCCRQMEQSWRMWWTICSASLQSQSVESMMPLCIKCARRLQCPVCNLNIVVCSYFGYNQWLKMAFFFF